MRFLTARWEHLLFANYVIPPDVLDPFLPAKTRIDLFDNKCFVSLVAFWFDETRVLGLKVPFHVRFEEINLRFYVTPQSDHSRRGVTFIKEIVPSRVIPWIANSLFRENYVRYPMTHEHAQPRYTYAWTNDSQHSISGIVEAASQLPQPGSVEEFITEHYWGYAGLNSRTLEYQVEHPQWPTSTLSNYQIAIDYARNYGPQFGILNDMQPYNVLYARGSEVAVLFPNRL
jgi:uncharacterized protein